jgi:hypothetical protein
LIKKQAGGLRVFFLVSGGSEVKSLRTTGLDDCPDLLHYLTAFHLIIRLKN